MGGASQPPRDATISSGNSRAHGELIARSRSRRQSSRHRGLPKSGGGCEGPGSCNLTVSHWQMYSLWEMNSDRTTILASGDHDELVVGGMVVSGIVVVGFN